MEVLNIIKPKEGIFRKVQLKLFNLEISFSFFYKFPVQLLSSV